ncbi:dTMP kinase [Agrobacterium vitis]|uniref:dTMP kinase n=1 Tax=Agrobacterium vitis TaxID=373 RepID=UPI002033B91A|nr:deoxynucleoside kinase [Agrobacterium vitis]MCM2450859.1 deoxynucleoside kinase [Agrobacterium vitis]MCM2471528.1 deoxynucleoside kinase [Agrobacterium vitis]
MYCAIEGLDGAGKSTVVPLVVQSLKDRGIRAEVKPEFPVGQLDVKFREVLDKGLFLAQHLEMPAAAAFFYLLHAEVISTKSIDWGNAQVVLADRCHITHSMYQAYFASKNPESFDVVRMLGHLEGLFADLDIALPEIIVLLDASVEEVLPRLREREAREVTADEIRVLRVFHSYYAELANRFPDIVIRIKADSSPVAVAEAVTNLILARVEPSGAR